MSCSSRRGCECRIRPRRYGASGDTAAVACTHLVAVIPQPTQGATFRTIQGGQTPITIVLADDHTIVRSGLHVLLESEHEFEVVAEAGDVEEAVRKVLAYKPRVLVLDLSMPGGSSLVAIPRMLK